MQPFYTGLKWKKNMDKDKKNAQEMICHIRKTTGLSRIDFCKKYNIPLRTMEEWEAGRRTPPEYIPRMLYFYVRYSGMHENELQDISGTEERGGQA